MKSDMKRSASIYQQDVLAGYLVEKEDGTWAFSYHEGYDGIPVSLTLPVQSEPYHFHRFPPFFEGLLPEGVMQEALLRRLKIDKSDYFEQLLAVGRDLVGSITIFPAEDKHGT